MKTSRLDCDFSLLGIVVLRWFRIFVLFCSFIFFAKLGWIKQVPLLVASAGITDIIVEALRMHGLLLDNVTVRANTMHFGRHGKLERFRESSPVHSRQEADLRPSCSSRFSENLSSPGARKQESLRFFRDMCTYWAGGYPIHIFVGNHWSIGPCS